MDSRGRPAPQVPLPTSEHNAPLALAVAAAMFLVAVITGAGIVYKRKRRTTAPLTAIADLGQRAQIRHVASFDNQHSIFC